MFWDTGQVFHLFATFNFLSPHFSTCFSVTLDSNITNSDAFIIFLKATAGKFEFFSQIVYYMKELKYYPTSQVQDFLCYLPFLVFLEYQGVPMTECSLWSLSGNNNNIAIVFFSMYKLVSHMERTACFVFIFCGYLMNLLPLNSSQESLCESSIEGLHTFLDFAIVNAFR